jgi:hypothetical protein
MRKKRHSPEEIMAKLRQVDVLVAQGTPVADAIRAIGVTEVYNSVRPNAPLGYRPPATEVFVPAFAAGPAPPTRRTVAPRPTLN